MPEILVFVDKGEKFKKRTVINWGDGASTEIDKEKIILHGRDGITRRVRLKEKHCSDCKKLLQSNGYSFRS